MLSTADQKLNQANYLQQNLKFLIKKYNLDNDSLAKITGLTSYTIASLRTRITNPTLVTLKPLAEFFNLTIDQLVYQDCCIDHGSQQQNLNLINNVNIPVIDIERASSWPFDGYKNNNINDINDINIEFITTTGKINNNCYAIKLDSEVLMPSYQKNTILIIDPNKTPQDSNIVLISIENNPLTYRQVFLDAGVFYFKPVNPDFGGMVLIKKYKIYGVVIRAIFDVV